MTYPRIVLDWRPAYRVVPTRYPAITLFDRVADSEDFEALYALEAMTNARVRDEVGDLSLVPPAERLYGPGSGPIMAAFTHLNPAGSRFSDGDYGTFYAARDKETAIAETVHHTGRFMRATRERAMSLHMRLYRVRASGEVVDLRQAAIDEPAIVDPDDYGYTQQLGRRLRQEGANGLIYPSVRHGGGECLAAFRTCLLSHCLHAAYLVYHWDGERVANVFRLTKIPMEENRARR